MGVSQWYLLISQSNINYWLLCSSPHFSSLILSLSLIFFRLGSFCHYQANLFGLLSTNVWTASGVWVCLRAILLVWNHDHEAILFLLKLITVSKVLIKLIHFYGDELKFGTNLKWPLKWNKLSGISTSFFSSKCAFEMLRCFSLKHSCTFLF